MLPISINDIKDARKNLEGNSRKTPLVKSFFLSNLKQGEIYIKLENMQLTGSFKFRGAFNKISSLTAEEKAKGVIACSAGNHAQGVALTAKLLGIHAKIVMPSSAPQAKVDATRGYGAEVILAGETFEDAKAKAEEICATSGEIFIHPYDDEKVMAGQGTIGLEILDEMFDVDNVIVPIGGGGLIAGIAIALKSYNPNIKIIGVQAENVHGMKSSFDANELTFNYTAPTFADGCAVALPGEKTFMVTKELVDEIVLVNEEEIKRAMKDSMQRCKQIVEGSGALPTAAIIANKVDKYLVGKKTVALVSGGNVSLTRVSEVVDHFFGTEL
ncbi:MAG: bifunctional threonine ammonia-lyase/L-serine ammonia-lyase TdcB [Mycoplasmatales bacterium]